MEHNDKDWRGPGRAEGRAEESEPSAGAGPGPEAEEPATEAAEESADERKAKREARRDVWERGFSEVQEVVNDILGSFRHLQPGGGRYPQHDLIQVPREGYWVLMDLPGVKKSDLEVTLLGDDLTVTGKRVRPELPEGSEVRASSRGYGRFRRELRMPSDVEPSGVKAKLEHGVLKVVLPRRVEAERQKVEIEG